MSSLIAEQEIRKRVGVELELLRDLCRALVTVTRAAGRDEQQRFLIRNVLDQIRAVADRHFSFEEEVIAPMLRELDAWGPVRVELLLEERAEQRSGLRALAEGARDGARSLEALADEIHGFFRRFDQQIAESKVRLLEAEVVGADPAVDQIDG